MLGCAGRHPGSRWLCRCQARAPSVGGRLLPSWLSLAEPCAWPPPAGLACSFWQLGLQRGCQWGSGLVFLFIHCGSGLGVHFVGPQRPSLRPEGLRTRLTDEPPPQIHPAVMWPSQDWGSFWPRFGESTPLGLG